jgi:uncharacterized protein YbbK (DUF523 family)
VTPRIGVSQCLMGEPVRHDGGHKHFPFVTDGLAAWADLVPVCPEVEFGLEIPREPIQLQATDEGDIRLVEISSGTDLTAPMIQWAAERVDALEGLGISGFVLKSKSPSCGLIVPVQGRPDPAAGLFAQGLTLAMSDLPVAEECDLETPAGQAAFADNVRAYAKRLNR